METKALYYEDAYLEKFESKIINIINRSEIAVESTACYPESGGQPADKAKFEIDGSIYHVVGVWKCNGIIYHKLDKDVPDNAMGKSVYGQIDWKSRYAFMRAHSTLHILNALMLTRFGVMVTGAQIGEESSRMDFQLQRGITPEERKMLEDEINSIIMDNQPINIKFINSEELRHFPNLKRTLNREIPKTNGLIRIVEIQGLENSAQACGGLHVKATKEIGQFKIQKIDNKGQNNRRIKIVII